MYKISAYTKAKAKKIGVNVRPSKTAGKKIDVFKNGQKLASIGAIGYNDYPTYMELEKKGKVPKGTAKERRKMYKIGTQKTEKDCILTDGMPTNYYGDMEEQTIDTKRDRIMLKVGLILSAIILVGGTIYYFKKSK